MAHNGSAGPNKLALAAGFGIGITWILIALFALYGSTRGAAAGRGDFQLVWGLVGTLLLAGGICAIVGTWWHNIGRPARHDHH